ncbi:HD domain-containing protein [Pseudomaricurvus alkylphenolicus]|uniref:HD domain-containing protein n=1 Tax=Pseudomaricurvus alkylphenolicus TaxID=1306991 RepID=UPI00142065D9|nr:HD domain-containing protein [Pseudomaricurvus alkylphenolicus]NIB44681.1 HD domain-containing protein [Pseudomaricurvus alkylphenolicus]
METSEKKSQASFTRMDQATKEDFEIIAREGIHFASLLPDRILAHLKQLDGSVDGFPVSRFEHCLQMATMCEKAGKDEEYIVCALLHDIGDLLGSFNHADIAAAILKPVVSEKNHWIVQHHAIFQGYYFFHHLGLDRNMRDQFSDHPYYDACVEFCKFDQAAFNPDYPSLPLAHFEPMVRRVFAEPKSSIYLTENGEMPNIAEQA